MAYKIERLPSGKVRAKVNLTVNGHPHRKCITKGTEDEVRLAAIEYEAAVLRGESGSVDQGIQKSWTLGYAYDKTFSVQWRGKKSEKTITLNADIVCKYFGKDTLVSQIGTSEVDAFIEHLMRKGNSDSTINRKLASLSTMLQTAVDSGGLLRKPKIRRRRENKGRIRFLAETEEKTMLELLTLWDKLDHRDAIEVLADTGLRLGELWRVTAMDFDFKQGILHIWSSKSGKPRSIPMTTRVREIMQRRLKVHGNKPFPYNNAWMRHLWDRMRAHLKLSEDQEFVPHCLRHTCASRLVQRGVPLRVVQEWLGHSSIVMTMRYAQLSPVSLLEAVKVLENREAS